MKFVFYYFFFLLYVMSVFVVRVFFGLGLALLVLRRRFGG